MISWLAAYRLQLCSGKKCEIHAATLHIEMKHKLPRPSSCMETPREGSKTPMEDEPKTLSPFDRDRIHLRDRAFVLATRYQHTIGYGIVRSYGLPYNRESSEGTETEGYVVVYCQLSGARDWNIYLEFYSPPDETSRHEDIVRLEMIDKTTANVVKSREVKILACPEERLGTEQKTEMLREMLEAALALETLDNLYPQDNTHPTSN